MQLPLRGHLTRRHPEDHPLRAGAEAREALRFLLAELLVFWVCTQGDFPMILRLESCGSPKRFGNFGAIVSAPPSKALPPTLDSRVKSIHDTIWRRAVERPAR